MKVLSLIAQPGEPRYVQSLQVNHWFWERGYDVIPFTRQQLKSGDLDCYLFEERESSIFYGAVAIVREALERAKRPAPPNIDFPEELRKFAGRRISDGTLGMVRDLVHQDSASLPIHVKPRYHQKLFKGQVVRSKADLLPISGVSDDDAVIIQESMQILSEWRATVLRGKVVNVSNYKGDPLRFPDPKVMAQGVADFVAQPIGYALDWGVVADGRTLLIEANDGFALGNYGTKGYLYTALVEARWRQLMGLPDNGVGWEAI